MPPTARSSTRACSRISQAGEATRALCREPRPSCPDIRAHFDVVLAAVAAGRAELVRLHRQGQIEDEVLHDLERDLDLEEMGAVYQRGE